MNLFTTQLLFLGRRPRRPGRGPRAGAPAAPTTRETMDRDVQGSQGYPWPSPGALRTGQWLRAVQVAEVADRV